MLRYTLKIRPGFFIPALAGAAAFLLYFFTACPTIYTGDAPELAAAGASFGIPHPPGYPLYMLCANSICRILPFGEPAWRINILSAASAAGAAVLLYLLAVRLGACRGSAAAAAAALATGASLWSQAVISEVYAFDVLLAAAALYACLRCRQKKTGGSLFAAAMLCSLWAGHRTVNSIYLPAAALLVWPVLKQQLRQPKSMALLLAALVVPCGVLLYLPLASMRDPLLDTGDPETVARFWDVITAAVYRQYLFSGPPGSFVSQLGFILQSLPAELGPALLLAPAGAVLLVRRFRQAGLAFLYIASANIFFAANYQVLDVMVFTFPLLLSCCTFAAIGAVPLFSSRWRTPAAACIVLAIIAAAYFNYQDNNLSRQTLCADFARDSLSQAGPNAVVLTNVDSVSFSLWYVQAAEKFRPDVTVISKGRAVDWYQEQIRQQRPDLNIQAYTGADAADIWPAKIIEQQAARLPVYLTSTLQGYFSPDMTARIGKQFSEVPAGLMMQLHPAGSEPSLAQTVEANRRFWQEAWPHVLKARRERLGADMAALLLHYASMRLLFARYCLWSGDGSAALDSAQSVLDLDTAAVIQTVNTVFTRKGFRYHMSDMPRQAAFLKETAELLRDGKLTAEQARAKLSGSATADMPADQLNQQGIRFAQQGQLEKALELFTAAAAQSPPHMGARVNRAKVLAALGRTREAAGQYRDILALAPENVLALAGLAELEKNTNPAEAEKLFRKALDLSRGTPVEDVLTKQAGSFR